MSRCITFGLKQISMDIGWVCVYECVKRVEKEINVYVNEWWDIDINGD